MSVLAVHDATGATVYIEVRGAGTQLDPFRPLTATGGVVAGVLAANAQGQPLSDVPVPCKRVYVFPTDADADVYLGDEDSQPGRLASIILPFEVDDVSLLWCRLYSANTGSPTGDIPWIAIV